MFPIYINNVYKINNTLFYIGYMYIIYYVMSIKKSLIDLGYWSVVKKN